MDYQHLLEYPSIQKVTINSLYSLWFLERTVYGDRNPGESIYTMSNCVRVEG